MIKISWHCSTCNQSGTVFTKHTNVVTDEITKATLVTESHRLRTSFKVGKGAEERLVEWCLMPVITTSLKEVSNE